MTPRAPDQNTIATWQRRWLDGDTWAGLEVASPRRAWVVTIDTGRIPNQVLVAVRHGGEEWERLYVFCSPGKQGETTVPANPKGPFWLVASRTMHALWDDKLGQELGIRSAKARLRHRRVRSSRTYQWRRNREHHDYLMLKAFEIDDPGVRHVAVTLAPTWTGPARDLIAVAEALVVGG